MKRYFIFAILLLSSCFTQRRLEESSVKPNQKSSIIYQSDTVYIDRFIETEPKFLAASEPEREILQARTSQNYQIKEQIKIVRVNSSSVYSRNTTGGNFVYRIPPIMRVRETYQVLARISRSEVNIYENLNGEVKQTTVPITESMEVKLIDPSPDDNKQFSIIADNVAVQLVDSTDAYTQWSWNVTPLRSGTANLKIVVSIIRDGKTKETVYEDPVKVEINPVEQVKFWFQNYWQWALTTLLIPLAKWLYDKFKKKQKDQE
jgi:hypothetical protein